MKQDAQMALLPVLARSPKPKPTQWLTSTLKYSGSVKSV